MESLLGTEPAEKPTFELTRDASFNLSSIEFFSGPGSGKQRRKIHLWLNKKIRQQKDWFEVFLYLSPSYLSRNYLARVGMTV